MPVRHVVLAAALTLLAVPACDSGDNPEAAPSSTTTTIDRTAVFCAVMADLNEANPFEAVEAASTPADANAAFKAGLAEIRVLEENPPDRVAAAITTYVEGFEAFGAELRAAEYNASRVDRDRLAAITQEVSAASARIDAFADTVC